MRVGLSNGHGIWHGCACVLYWEGGGEKERRIEGEREGLKRDGERGRE